MGCITHLLAFASYDSLQGSHLHYNLNLLDDGVLIFSLQQDILCLLYHIHGAVAKEYLQIVVRVVQVQTNNRGEETMMYLFFLFFTIFIIYYYHELIHHH